MKKNRISHKTEAWSGGGRLPLQGVGWSRYSHIVFRFFQLKESNMGVTWATLDLKLFMSAFICERSDKIPISLRATLKR